MTGIKAPEQISAEVKQFSKKKNKLKYKKRALVKDIADAITDRLLRLYEAQKQPASFEDWLGSCFEYDTYSAFSIFKRDSVLKQLVDDIVEIDYQLKEDVAILVNASLKDLGYNRGVHRHLNDVARI